MLYETSDIDNAIPTIIEVLNKAGFDKKTTIGRRVNIDGDDWFYEVLYPTNFNGVFLTM